MQYPTRRLSWIVLLACLLLAAGLAPAQEAPLLAKDPALEAQMRDIAHELRCLVCQNETIADSDADLAVDLRNQIRQQLHQGRTPEQIRQFMVDRYGEFILFRPRFSTRTLLLWIGPFVLLLLAVTAMLVSIRRRSTLPEASLSPEEAQRARELLGTAEEESR